MSARIAWLLAALTALLIAADIATTAAYESLGSEHAVAMHGFPFVEAAVVGSGVMGAVILSRYPRHLIGWLLCLVGVSSALSLLTEAYSVWVIYHHGPGTRAVGGIAAWLSQLFGGQLSIAMIAVLFLVAPDGRLMSRRWRSVAWISVLGAVSCTAALLTQSPATYDTVRADTEFGPLAAALFSIGFLLISIGLVGSLVSMLLRLRASTGEQRAQVALVACAAALLVAGVLVLFVIQATNGGKQTVASSVPLFVAFAAMPVLFAIAVLRYRLFDIDIIVNRAVILAIGTAFAGLGYTALVVSIGAAVNARTSGFWLSLSATAIVALAFQPLRSGVVRLANRLAYGARAAPYQALSEFSRKLAEIPTERDLLHAVAEATGLAVDAASCRVTLELPGTESTTVVWTSTAATADDEHGHETVIRDDGDVVGTITVRPRRGRTLRDTDVLLVEDLAAQAAPAFRNAATMSRLAEHVAALDETNRQLADSRRRLIEADDAARMLLERAIAREVFPHLEALPGRLAALRAMAEVPEALDGLDRSVATVNDALERLREITRGVFPTQLARSGLAPALRSMLARNGLDGRLDVSSGAAEPRFAPRIEAAVFFCCSEAARCATTSFHIDLRVHESDLVLLCEGVAIEDAALQAIKDRVEATGGIVHDGPDHTLAVSIPVGDRLAVGSAPPRPR